MKTKLVTGRFFMERMLPETRGAPGAHPVRRGHDDGAAGGGVLAEVFAMAEARAYDGPAAANAARCATCWRRLPEEFEHLPLPACARRRRVSRSWHCARVRLPDLTWTRGAPTIFRSSNRGRARLLQRGAARRSPTAFVEGWRHQRLGVQPRRSRGCGADAAIRRRRRAHLDRARSPHCRASAPMII